MTLLYSARGGSVVRFSLDGSEPIAISDQSAISLRDGHRRIGGKFHDLADQLDAAIREAALQRQTREAA